MSQKSDSKWISSLLYALVAFAVIRSYSNFRQTNQSPSDNQITPATTEIRSPTQLNPTSPQTKSIPQEIITAPNPFSGSSFKWQPPEEPKQTTCITGTDHLGRVVTQCESN